MPTEEPPVDGAEGMGLCFPLCVWLTVELGERIRLTGPVVETAVHPLEVA